MFCPLGEAICARAGGTATTTTAASPSANTTPAHSSPWAISNRLRQLGYPKSLYGDKTFIREIRILMAEANIAGRRAVFDEPDELGKLVDAAQGRISGRDRVAAD